MIDLWELKQNFLRYSFTLRCYERLKRKNTTYLHFLSHRRFNVNKMNSQIWGSDLQWFLRSGGLKFCCQGARLGRHVGFADTKMFSGSWRHAQWVCFRLIPRDTSRAILAAFTANIPANIHWIGNNFIHRFGKFVFLVFSLWTIEFVIIKGVIFM